MKFNVTAADLRRIFPGLDLAAERLVNQLNLDLGHLQLLRDCYQAWQFDDGVDSCEFWLMLLALVSEVNEGSLCLALDHQNPHFNQSTAMNLFNSRPLSFFQLDGFQILSFDGERLYFYKYHHAELAMTDSLNRLVSAECIEPFSPSQMEQVIFEVSQSVAFPLSAEQVLAMATSLSKPFSIISGGPGTGKTTIMGSVLRCLVRLGLQSSEVALAAPTGRAAYRMTESLRHGLQADVTTGLCEAETALLSLEATTIHRLLGANPSRKQHRYHAGNVLPFKLIVVDEVSMVDMMLMQQLLAAIADGCRVILLGDQFQLPSVSSGAVLADLMPDVNQALAISPLQKALLHSTLPKHVQGVLSGFESRQSDALLLDCVTVLTDSKRCQDDIAHLSEHVRKGDASGFMNNRHVQKIDSSLAGHNADIKEGLFWNATEMSGKTWQTYYLDWLVAHYFKLGKYQSLMDHLRGVDYRQLHQHTETIDAVFMCIQSNRILTLVNQGEVGTEVINHHVCEMMKRCLNVNGNGHLFHGAVITVRRNDSGLKLFNGDIGVLFETEQGQLRAMFPAAATGSQGSTYQSYSIHVIPEFTAAFAMTVHKSQGSEFNHVLMPLPHDTDHRLLSREIIYTGMTRAKQSVQLVGSEAALQAGIRRKNIRHTGLRLWE